MADRNMAGRSYPGKGRYVSVIILIMIALLSAVMFSAGALQNNVSYTGSQDFDGIHSEYHYSGLSTGFTSVATENIELPGPATILTRSSASCQKQAGGDAAWCSGNNGDLIGIAATETGTILIAGRSGSVSLYLDGIGRPEEFLPAGPGRIRVSKDRVAVIRPGYTEWYAVEGAGIEQGMTIFSRLPGNGTLLVNYTLAGDLRPALAGQTLVFFNATGPAIYYGGLAAHDATGRRLPATLAHSPGTLTWQVDDRNAAYPIVIDPWIATQAATLTALDAGGTGGAQFGYSVALSGDGRTAIIGASAASFSGMSYAGQAYVYTNRGGTWSEAAILNATDMAENAGFGQSAAISTDGGTAVIGANSATANMISYAGQAYIYTNSGGTWSETAILNASDAEFSASFGNSVAISDDGNTVLVSAPYFNSNSGKVYVFTNTDGSWSQSATLTALDAAASDYFGYSVTISDDGDIALIGAYNKNSGTGRAYMFTNTAGTWSQSGTLTASDAAASDYFGYSVAISDDGDIALIGALNKNSGTGQAYMFTNTAGTWSQSGTLTALDAKAGDNFANSVALSGDTAVIGAYRASAGTGKANSGKSYVFKRTKTDWAQTNLLSPSDTAAGDYFGYSMALSGDENTAVIGANHASVGSFQYAGKAYVFAISSTAPQVHRIEPSSGPNTTSACITVYGIGIVKIDESRPSLELTRNGYGVITPSSVLDPEPGTARACFDEGIPAGVWNVTVINPDGEEGTNASVTFTSTAPPVLAGISPASAHNTAPTQVTVTGSQFNSTVAPAVRLRKAGSADTLLTGSDLSTTSFTVSVPADMDAGTWGITVINPDGLEGTKPDVTFTVTAPPRVTGIDPAHGADAPFTLVTITGLYFDSTVAPVVNLSSAGQTNITLTPTDFSATFLKVTVPNNNIDAIWNVTVINPDGLEGTNASVTFSTIDPPPVADYSFLPTGGLPPLTVTFTDKTINAPDSWLWDFGDGETTGATDQNPVHTYTKPGTYPVSLSATNSLGTGTKTVQKAISVPAPLTHTTVLNAGSDAADDATWGAEVALSQDGNTALAGGGSITLGPTPPGKAWVFKTDGGTWSREQVLRPSESAESDNFGHSLAISDDGNIAIIGAPNADVGAVGKAGKAYIFNRNEVGEWSEKQVLTASVSEAAAIFGQSVDISSEGNIIIIGAPFDGVGKAYVFQKQGGVWSENRILSTSDAEGRGFGWSVALSDDGDTALLGALDSDVGAVGYAGKAYVFTRDGEGVWSEKQALAASDPNNDANFGWSVAMSGDANTAVIGAPDYKISDDGHDRLPGQVYIFKRDGEGIWSQKQGLNDMTDKTRDCMGQSVSISPDGKIVYPGYSRIYQNDGEWYSWTHSLITPTGSGPGFESSVVFQGTTVLVGSTMHETPAGDGQAYFFTLSALAPVVGGISPKYGANTTTTTVTITGTNFATTSAPVVKLSRNGYTDVVLGIVSGTSSALVRTVPAHLDSGVWNIVVVNPDGQEGTTASVAYTVLIPPPSVTSVIPATAVNNEAASVEITGLLFNTTMPGETTVNLTRSGYPNISVFGITPHSTTGITVRMPVTSAETGIWHLIVVNPDGQESTESIPFRITGEGTLPPPSVLSVSPSNGINTGPVTAIITGTGFNTTINEGTTLNLTRSGSSNITITGITPGSSTGISVVLPINNAVAGTWHLVIINPDGQESMELITFVVTSPDQTPVPTTIPVTLPETTAAPSGSSGSAYSGSRHYTSMRNSGTGQDSTKTENEQLAPPNGRTGNGNNGHPGDSGPAPGSGSPRDNGGAPPTGTGLPLSITAALIGAGGIGVAGSAWYIRRWQFNKKQYDPIWWKGGK